MPGKMKITERMRLYKYRIPFLLEDYLGFNRRYEIAYQIPNNLVVIFLHTFIFHYRLILKEN